MKPKEWNIEDEINTKLDLMEYLEAALAEGDFYFTLVACEDFIKITKKKGWKYA